MPNIEVTATGNVQPAVASLDKLDKALVNVTKDANNLNPALSKVSQSLATTAVASTKLDSSLSKSSTGTSQAANALQNLGRIAQDAPFGFIGIQNNLNPLLESFQRLKIETGSTGGALKALGSSLIGAGGLGLAVSVVTSLMTFFAISQQGVKKELSDTEKAIEATNKKIKDYKDLVDGIVSSLAKEAADTSGLIAILKNETETRGRKLAAIKELQKIQPEIFNNLKLEKDAVIGVDLAYQNYIDNFKTIIAAKLLQAQIEQKITQILKIQGAEQTTQQKEAIAGFRKYADSLQAVKNSQQAFNLVDLKSNFSTFQQADQQVNALNSDIKDLVNQLSKFSKGVQVSIPDIKIKPEKVTVDKTDLLQKLGDVFNDPTQLSRASGSTLTPTVNIEPKFQINIPENEQNKILDAFNRFILNEKLTDAINASISTLINDTISNVAQSVTDALTGGKDVVPRLFDNIVKGIGQQIKELGKFLVKIGIEKLAIDKAIKALNLNPAIAIAAGFAAQVLGSLLIAAASRKSSGVGQGFASGTRSSPAGSFLVGERGPELITLPRGSAVQPNNELTAYGGGGITLQPSIAYDGTMFRIFLNRVDAQMGRNN